MKSAELKLSSLPESVSESLSLQPGQVRSLPVRRGWQVRAESGLFWLTLDHAAGDILLAAGTTCTLPADGLLVMEMLAPQAGQLVLLRQVRPAGLGNGAGNLMQPLRSMWQSVWQSLSALSFFAKGHFSHADARFSRQNTGLYFPAHHDLP